MTVFQNDQDKIIDLIIELQSLAQNGLAYCKDNFDIERFKRVRAIAAELMGMKSGISTEVVKDLFCNESGFQTPKIDTRAAIFKDDKILLVREKRDGLWALPGGWVDVDQSIRSNTVKEVREESGMDVEALRIIAIQDRKFHNKPKYAFNVCKVFVECKLLGGSFVPNLETSESGFFELENLPELSEAKNTKSQVQLCFHAHKLPYWEAIFD